MGKFVTYLVFMVSMTNFFRWNTGVIAKELKGSQTGYQVLSKADSPHTITADVVVEPEATIEIQAGAQLNFREGVGLKVHGTLTAVGTVDERITFTKFGGGSVSDAPPQWPSTIRLANGSDIQEGVVQVLFQGRWKSICANSANWTAQDAETVCRESGFARPVNNYFTYNFTAIESHEYIAISQPGCSGKESRLFDCPGSKAPKYSSQICRDQRSLYLKCEGLRDDLAVGHWKGIQFYNTSYERVVNAGDSLNESTSTLHHVDVLYAGVTGNRLPTAAISASPYVPTLVDVRVMFSAYDAINFTDINSTSIITDSEVAHNRGHGLNITSSFGRVRITRSNFHHNRGNGLYVRTVDKIFRQWDWRTGDFCSGSTASAYPQLYTGQAPAGLKECTQKFVAAPGQFLTVSLLEMEKDPIVGGAWLKLYNGDCRVDVCPSAQAPLLREWTLRDLGTIGLPQSEVTTGDTLTVVFTLENLSNRPNLCRVVGCVRFVLLVTSAVGTPSEDVILNDVWATDNNMHGALIENPRSFIKVTDGQFSRNAYGAGFRIRGGAADLDMRNTLIDDNAHSGINVTYSGGRRILSQVKARRNQGPGMYFDYIHEYKTREERHQKTELISVTIEDNKGVGLRAGNYCADSVLAINVSSTISRNRAEGVKVVSCYGEASGLTNFTMKDSTMLANGHQAISISPMISMNGSLERMTFREHSRGVLLFDNTADLQLNRVFLDKKVDFLVEHNDFHDNSGPYVVNVRLTETSIQKLRFQFNTLTGNVISPTSSVLKPRSRARAVIVLSSSNVLVNRNTLINRNSQLEIATHSIDTAITIDASKNWWGDPSGSNQINDLNAYYKRIVAKILDGETRYNLALVNYFPALVTDNLEGTPDSRDGIDDPRQFSRMIDGMRYLGGKMKADFTTLSNTRYIVDADINIEPTKEFKLSPGTVLEFNNTVGILVRGKMFAVGSEVQPIVLKRREEENPHANISWMRFTGGDNELEGVLELNLTGEWSTVCNKGWTMREASVVCQQFGYTLQPELWTVDLPQDRDFDQPILYNYVRCLDSDSDIQNCIHDKQSEFNDCTHEDDVIMKCIPPTWAGVKLVATARQSELRHVTIDEAGLLDYFTNEFVPALQVDRNYHLFSHLHINRSSSTGMNIVYAEPFGIPVSGDISTVNSISNSVFSNNFGDGFATMSSYLTLENCAFTDNGRSGFRYNPKISLLTAFDVRRAISSDQITNIDTRLDGTTIQIDTEGAVKYLQANNTGLQEDYSIMFELKAAQVNQRVTVQLLDYSPETHIERLVIYDGRKEDIGVAQRTAIEEDNVDLPLVSSSDILTLVYSINGTKSGRLTLSISSKAQNDVPDMGGVVPHNIRATIRLKNCQLTNNQRGLLLTHYNNPSDENMDLFVRNKYEQVILDTVMITGNREEAMLVPSVTKYNEIFMPTVQVLEMSHRMANITYHISNSVFSNNGRGIVAEHNHVDFSNNMWRWLFKHNQVSNNEDGGLVIELPLILDPYHNGNHSVELNHSRFANNQRFEFAVTGGFANMTIFNNTFQDNTAKKGLILLAGTEKKMFVSQNELLNNKGKYMMEVDMTSHSEFGVNQPASIFKNRFKDNQWTSAVNTQAKGEEATVSSYTMALRGVQKVNITRNIFTDQLAYTFVADVPSTSLTTEVNVRYNYWSTQDQSVIRENIFDFSDWSSYAIANYTGFLLTPDFNSQTSTEPMETVQFDLDKPLGGVISSDLTIPYRKEDYRVVSDITILSGVTVKVEPGVTFRINANIGFLVLGRLLANGLSRKKIRFLPVERDAADEHTARYRRQLPEQTREPANLTEADGRCRDTSVDGLRLCGGEDEKEGFLRLYNTTINAWSLVCDPQFNDRTAEVFCRSMGYYSGNVAVRYSELYEYFTFGQELNLYNDLWTRTYLCQGDESHMDDCGQRINYNLQRCSARRGYVFIRCGERNLDPAYDYWGNIRFAVNSAEAGSDVVAKSSLRNVEIMGAGVLHGNKVSAVMSTYQSPSTYSLDIHDCASGGLDFISPRSDVFLLNSRVRNNQGTAINILVLNGEKGEQASKFKALNSSSVPYRVFGMISMCDSAKVIDVDRRVLVYYKYDFHSVDCVKVFRNIHRTQVNIRFLQVNLFDDDFSRNSVEVFDGPDFVDGFLLKDIRANSTEQEKRSVYKTTTYYNVEFQEPQQQYQMGLHVHASPAAGIHGFIAEITTSSNSYTGAKGVHKVIGNEFYKNSGGSLRYSTVGETNPGIIVTGNVFRQNGLGILNLTSTENVLIEAQNVLALSVSNNMLVSNNGSCTVWLNADGDASKVVRGNVSNNVFYGTINGEALRIYGNSYQEIMILFNYFVSNAVDNLNTVDLRYVIVNVTGNTMYKNKGAHGMDIWSDSDITSSKMLVELNQFYDNFPGDKFVDAQTGGNNTMLYAAGHYSNKRIRNNWFENKFHFELSTHNRTSTNEKPARDPTMSVDAEYNFWGHEIGVDNTELIIRARMHDYRDDTNLSMIDYSHFYADNISLPQVEGSYKTGYCLVGWKLTLSQRCYRYYGGVATYTEAVSICGLENATIVKPNNQFWVEIGKVVRYSQQDYSEQVRAWVDEPESARPPSKCSVVIDSRYDEADCLDRLPFVCESDQIGALSPTWKNLVFLWVLLGVGGFLILLAVVFVIVWCRKSQLRKEQRFERRASLRSSIRSNKYAINNGALTQGSQTNLATSLYGSRNALSNRPMARGRAGTREPAPSIALTDYTIGETDVDNEDSETELTRRNGYTSAGSADEDSDVVGDKTPLSRSLYSVHAAPAGPSLVKGYAASVDYSRTGSRDDLSQASQPTRYTNVSPLPQPRPEATEPAPPTAAARPQAEFNRYRPRSTVKVDYNNEAYDNSPKHATAAPSAEQYQPATVQPAPRGLPGSQSQPEVAYVNTSRLYREPTPEPSVDVDEAKRRQLYSQRRPAKAPPAPPVQQREPQRPAVEQRPHLRHNLNPPSYNTATRGDNPPLSLRAPISRGDDSLSTTKRNSFSTLDTKSLDSYDTEYSLSKPPLSSRSYDHLRQTSDEKKLFETDSESMYSEDQPDRVRYRGAGRATYHPSPLASDEYRGPSPQARYEVRGREYDSSYAYGTQYAAPPAETDIDAMSEMTDDWNRPGPPVETDF